MARPILDLAPVTGATFPSRKNRLPVIAIFAVRVDCRYSKGTFNSLL
jgi:hypothetical protein